MWAWVLLALGAASTAYIMAGYPLLLAFGKFRHARPVRKDRSFQPAVTAVLAVYNGAQFIRGKLESMLALRYPRELLDILVVSDGSNDGTDEIVASLADRGVRLLSVPHTGKAAALNAALAHCRGEIVFFTDVRQDLDPEALAHLTANFADPTVGVVTGELRSIGQKQAGEQADMELYWRYELWVRRRHCEIDSMFGSTGCIYAVRRSLLEPLPPDTLADDAVIPLRAFFRGYRVIFDSAALAFDYPMAEGVEFRRRLRTLAGLWQVYVRMPQLLTGANRMRMHFISHKFARLALPWALIAAGVGTQGLPESWFRTTLLAGAWVAAILALVDGLVPKSIGLKRLTSPAHTFVVMTAAALLAVIVFVVPPARLWGTTRVKVLR